MFVTFCVRLLFWFDCAWFVCVGVISYVVDGGFARGCNLFVWDVLCVVCCVRVVMLLCACVFRSFLLLDVCCGYCFYDFVAVVLCCRCGLLSC